MLQTAKPDKKAREVTVLRGGVEAVRLRRAPAPSGEGIAADLGDGTWVFAGTWHGHYRVGEVTGRPTKAPDDSTAPLRARYAGDTVREVVLDGRRLEITRKSTLRGMHRYAERGQWLAETGAFGYFRVRVTLTADEAMPLHEQIFLLCLDLYTCRRNSSAAVALGFSSVPVAGI